MAIDRTRLATALWIAWAVVVWNLVFDQVLVFAGRRYVAAASLAASRARPYLRIDDWMRPALARAAWSASLAAAILLIVGLVAIRAAARRARPSHRTLIP